MTLFAAAMGLVGVALIACLIAELELGETLFVVFIASPWLANYLAGMTVKR